jgi:hypothetical protein
VWAVPELRVQLGTLVGCDGEPGEVPGWGYVPAWLARHLVARMHSAEWRYALCDENGHVIDGGLITTRPAAPDRVRVRRDARRGGIVEIAFRAGDPTRLINTPATHQADTHQDTNRAAGATAAWAPVLAELARVGTATGDPRQQPDPAEAALRTPRAGLRRWIQQRDRRCVHPCCRVPASKADQDHRIGYAHGGPTIEANLSTPCRHDHRLKDEGHWTLSALQPGLTVWTSPLGHHYQSRPPPAIPRPAQARTYQPGREPLSSPTSWPDACSCLLTPCPHDQNAAAANDATAEPTAGTEHTTVDTERPTPEILDDAEPPF